MKKPGIPSTPKPGEERAKFDNALRLPSVTRTVLHASNDRRRPSTILTTFVYGDASPTFGDAPTPGSAFHEVPPVVAAAATAPDLRRAINPGSRAR